MKTLLACALGLGFLFLDAHSKPSVAFLGLSRESDPDIRENLGGRIQYELSADTGLFVFPKEDISMLFAKGVLNEPEASSEDMPRLAKSLGAQYYAFGKLESISDSTSRKWWKPWDVKVKWRQGLRLRILEASSGISIFDGTASGELAERAFFFGPDPWDRMSPMERDGYLKRMLPVLSVESAKTIAKAVKEKSNPARTDTAAASVGPGNAPVTAAPAK